MVEVLCAGGVAGGGLVEGDLQAPDPAAGLEGEGRGEAVAILVQAVDAHAPAAGEGLDRGSDEGRLGGAAGQRRTGRPLPAAAFEGDEIVEGCGDRGGLTRGLEDERALRLQALARLAQAAAAAGREVAEIARASGGILPREIEQRPGMTPERSTPGARPLGPIRQQVGERAVRGHMGQHRAPVAEAAQTREQGLQRALGLGRIEEGDAEDAEGMHPAERQRQAPAGAGDPDRP